MGAGGMERRWEDAGMLKRGWSERAEEQTDGAGMELHEGR